MVIRVIAEQYHLRELYPNINLKNSLTSKLELGSIRLELAT